MSTRGERRTSYLYSGPVKVYDPEKNHPQGSESTVNFRSDSLIKLLSSLVSDATWSRPSIRLASLVRPREA